MWNPREPDVLGQAARPWSWRTSLATIATSPICSHGTPGTGSRALRSSAGRARGPRRLWCEVGAAEVDDVREGGGVPDDDLLRRGAGPVLELGDLDPVGSLRGRPLLPDGLLVDALDEALEDHRPAGHAAQRAVGH